MICEIDKFLTIFDKKSAPIIYRVKKEYKRILLNSILLYYKTTVYVKPTYIYFSVKFL